MLDGELDKRNAEAKRKYNSYKSGAAKETAITWNKFFMKLARKSIERPGIDPKQDDIVKNGYNIDIYFI